MRYIEKYWSLDRPRNAFCVVSPTDPDPRWPNGYVAVHREAGAQEKTIADTYGHS